jgi:hypothetical protein
VVVIAEHDAAVASPTVNMKSLFEVLGDGAQHPSHDGFRPPPRSSAPNDKKLQSLSPVTPLVMPTSPEPSPLKKTKLAGTGSPFPEAAIAE